MRAETFFSKRKWRVITGSIVLIILLSFSGAWAQYTPRSQDTLRVVDVSGSPGDTAVWVEIYLRNSISVSAFTLRLIFDDNLIVPKEILVGSDTNVVVEPTSRDTFFTDLSKSFAAARNDSIITFIATSLDETIYTDTIASGTGPVARFLFTVNSGISNDTSTTIRFEDDPDNPGNYNLIAHVTKSTADQYRPTLTNGTFYITAEGPPGNNVPVFATLASQFEVIEGQTLAFTVSASDQDGDTVTLSADALPANATFPTTKGDSVVSQTFSFSPDFTQGPDTISVTFRARDEHGSSSLKTVTIIINAVPQDLLIVSEDRGGVPGSTARFVPLILTNLQDVYGVQFTLHFDPSAIQVDSLVPAERINGFSLSSNLGDSSDQVTVLVYGLNNEFMPSGTDTILYFVLSVDSLALPGQKPLNLTNAREAIGIGLPSKELQAVDGYFTVDKFGDVNIDTLVDVADVVNLVAYILGSATLNQRQLEAADINRDGDVNVGDLVGVINTILGRPLNAPLERLSEPLAYLRLDYDSLVANSSGRIDVWADLETAVSGAQLKIKYDPDQLSFSLPELTSRSTGFNLCYKKDEVNGILTLLLYRYYSDPIHSGQGSILSLPVITSNNFDKQKLELKEAILADTGGAVIPVDKGEVILPKVFSLNQNYPNPFNPNTTIRFEIGSGGGTQGAVNTTLRIYNLLGQLVKTLVDEPKLPGVYYQTWDGKNGQGEKVSSGVYFYQLRVGDFNQTKKMVLMK